MAYKKYARVRYSALRVVYFELADLRRVCFAVLIDLRFIAPILIYHEVSRNLLDHITNTHHFSI